MNKRTYIILGLIIVGMATRLIPHYPNFTAVGAVALLGGALFKKRIWAFILPLAILFLSDLILNNVMLTQFYDGFVWFTSGFAYIYGAFFLSVLIGAYGIKASKPLGILGGALGSAVLFYLITNFGVWLGNPMYPQSLSGLLLSYEAGLPFLLSQALSTITYSAVLFGAAWYLVPSYQMDLGSARSKVTS